jgi:ATP-dependent Clp protease ATP-binding subunit ClpC
VFERLTKQARQVVVRAQVEARELKHDYIATEHILLAVVSEHEAVAAGVLRDLGVDLDHARRTVIQTRAAAHGRPPLEEVPPAGPEAGGSAATDEDGPRATSSQVH